MVAMNGGELVSMILELVGKVGNENVPARGGALIVANHRNPLLEPMSIAYNVERPVNFVAASVAFKPPVVNRVVRALGR